MWKKAQELGQLITTLESVVIIVTFCSTFGVAIWSVTKDLGPISIPIITVTLVSGLYAYAWVKGYKSRRGIPRNELKDTIVKWAMAAGHRVGESPNPGTVFSLELTHDERHVIIAQLNDTPDIILLRVGVRLDAKHKAVFDKLSQTQRDSITRRLVVEISKTGVSWSGLESPLDSVNLISHVVFDTGLDRTRLLDAIFDIRRTQELLIQLINLELNPLGSEQPND